MFLHKQDRAYSVSELYEFVEKADLNFVDYLDPLEKILLRPENYIKDFSLLEKVKKMDKVTREAISEILTGNIIKHSFYVSNQKDSEPLLMTLIIYRTSIILPILLNKFMSIWNLILQQ